MALLLRGGRARLACIPHLHLLAAFLILVINHAHILQQSVTRDPSVVECPFDQLIDLLITALQQLNVCVI